MNYHKLLSRQINRYLPVHLQHQPELQKFLSVVSDAYHALERDRELAERAFDISEQEYVQINARLEDEAEVKRQSIEKLKEAVGTITGTEMHNEADDLLVIARFLNEEVSKRKSAEAELQKLSLIIQQTINAVIITNNKGEIEWVNSAFEAVTGYHINEVRGRKPGSFLQGPATDQATAAYIRQQMARAQPFSCEIYNYRKNGEGYWLRVNGQPVFDDQGNVVQFFAIEEDITKEKESNAKLQEFDKRLNLALQKVGDNVWEHDFTTEETSFSKHEYSLLGQTSQSVESNVILWYNSIHKEDLPLVNENDRRYRAGEVDHHSLEYRMIDSDGNTKWVLDRGVVIEKTPDGKPLRIIGTHTDITRQKNTEAQLKAAATRLSSLITNLYAGVLLEDENRTISLVNKKFCDIFGIPVDPVLLKGADCSQAAEQSKNLFADPAAFVERINYILDNKELVIGDELEMMDGRCLQRDFIPIWNDDKYGGHLWVYTDITDKVNAGKKLEQQRLFYEKILDNIPADIAVFDAEHRYQYLNPTAIKDDEVRKWIIGKKDEDYLAFRNKPMSLLKGRRDTFNRVVASKTLHEWEEEIANAQGEVYHKLRRMYPVQNESGEVNMVIGYGLDITNIKKIQQQITQSEKRYRDVIENSLAIVTTHDLNGNFLTVNPMVKTTYGYEEEEVVGSSLLKFVPEKDQPFFNAVYLDKIKAEKQASGIFRIVHKDGHVVYSLYHNFLKEEPGTEPYVIGFAVDITDRVKAEKDLLIAKRQTEELAQAKQNFLANMSHEIRTPMNAIMGMANQLSKTTLTPDQQFYLNVIHSSADNLLIIINDILDLNKIEAGKLTLEQIGFEPKLVVGRVMQVMMHKAEEKGLALTNSHCDNKLHPVLLGDPYRLNQVLLNLISNAIKFTEKGAVDISCRVVADSPTSQTIKVQVADTGIGMDQSYLKNLFQKFTQEDESVTRRFGGTGLGMSICKELMELMGGTIDVESEKGKGSTFTLHFTFEKGKDADLPVRDTAHIDTIVLHGKRILMTDDNEMNRLVAATILKNYGAIVEEAQNGQEAIEKIKANPYDIVLMDVQMPQMDGIEATRNIRASISKNLPIIALTAFALKGDDVTFLEAGMNDYISKPFDEGHLLKTISRWVGKGDLHHDTVPASKAPDTTLYNLAKLEEISRGKQAFVEKMIALFVQHGPTTVAEISAAYQSGDFEKVKKLAHRLRPSIDNLGIALLKNDLHEMEQLAEAGKAGSRLETLVEKLNKVVGEVVESLNSRTISEETQS